MSTLTVQSSVSTIAPHVPLYVPSIIEGIAVPLPMTSELAKAITGSGLGRASKMPGPTYSLPVESCITGGKARAQAASLRAQAIVLEANGDHAAAEACIARANRILCGFCYAAKGRFIFPTVLAAHRRNLASLQHPLWARAMAYLINVSGTAWFRWHSAGDLQSLKHLENICEVARQTPHVRHWLPTKERVILNAYIKEHGGEAWPTNLQINYSSPVIDTPNVPHLPYRRVGIHMVVTQPRDDVHMCPAPHQGNACGECRACWQSPYQETRLKVTAFIAH